MATVQQMLLRLQSLTLPALQEMAREEILKEERNLRLVKESEFAHGERPDGSIIGRYSSIFYRNDKERRNPLAGGNVDLIDTGAFVRSAHVIFPRPGVVSFGFSDYKAADLFRKYNTGKTGQKSIANINQATFDRIQIEVLKPRFARRIRRHIGQV